MYSIFHQSNLLKMANSQKLIALFLVTLLVFSLTMETTEALWNPFKKGSQPINTLQGKDTKCTNPKDCPGELIKS